MKTERIFVAFAIVFSALTSLASAQTFQYLDPVAAKYDLFITAGPNASKEDDRNYMDFKEGGFEGLMGLGQHSWNYVAKKVGFSGTLNRHSQLYDLEFEPKLLPGSTVNAPSASINADLAAADAAIKGYITYLNSLSTTQSFGNRTTALTYNTSSDVTVLDFNTITMDGSGDSIVLNGRASGNDVIVIRVAGDALWEDGAPVTLNNLNQRNVIWLAQNNSNFDLHKNDGANFEGVIINHSTVPQDDYTTIIGDVDFTGQVYASHIKLGTDVYITGSSTIGPPVPEPSSALLFLATCGGLMFVRRRR